MPFLRLLFLTLFPIMVVSKMTVVLNFNFEYYNDPKSYISIAPEQIEGDFSVTLCVRINMEVWKTNTVFVSEKLSMYLRNFKNPG
jgi:hypothetical protein